MARSTDEIDPQSQQDALNRRMALLQGSDGGPTLDQGIESPSGGLQVPPPEPPQMDESTPTGTQMTPTGSQEHTPGGQELLGHAGGPSLGDINRFAAQIPSAPDNNTGDNNDNWLNNIARSLAGGLGNAATNLPVVGPIVTGLQTAGAAGALARRLDELTAGGGAASSTSGTTSPTGAAQGAGAPPSGASDNPGGTGPTGQPTPTPTPPVTTTPGFDSTGKFTPGGASSTGGGSAPTGAGAGTTTPPPGAQDFGSLLSHPQTAGAAGAGAGAIGAGSAGAGAAPSGAGSGSIGGAPGGGGSLGGGDLGSVTSNLVSQLNEITAQLNGPSASPDATGAYMVGLKSILDMLNQQETQLRADAANGQVIDPQTQQALDALRANLTGSLQKTQEDLNRRGLYNSGVLLDLENKLRTGNASDQANVLNTRLSQMRDELNKNLSSIRQNQFSAANNFYGDAAKAQTSSDELTRKLRQDLIGQRLNTTTALRGQMSTEDRARQDLAQQMAMAQQKQAFDAQQSEAQRQNAVQLEQMRLAAARRAGGGTGTAAPTQINNPYGGNTPLTKSSGTGQPAVNARATNAAINALAQYPDRTAAENDIATHYDAMTSAGVDPQALQDALDTLHPPSQEEVRGTRRVGGPI